MFYQRKRRYRRIVVLASAAGLAGVLSAASGDDRPPALDVRREAQAAKSDKPPAPKPDPLATAIAKGKLVGDSALAGKLDLATMRLEEDGYWVDFDKGRARLTLEPDLQKRAHKLLVQSRAPQAAIVMMDPKGRILALAGRKHGPPADETAYELATEVWAPSASVFKIVTAAALLKSGVKADEKVCFHGGIRSVMESNLDDDPRRDNRCGDLRMGVSESQNAIMAKLAHKRLSAKTLAATARAFGFEQAPSFALAAEPSTFEIPEPGLERAKMAAGFWSSELSAMGGAILTNVAASRGMRVQPQLVSEIVTKDGRRIVVEPAPAVRAIDRKTADILTDMMVATTETGTGSKAFRSRAQGTPLHGMSIAGKTGSLSRVKPSYLGYSWFVSFAPADKPEVIVSVILGNPMSWYLKAHTTARILLETALTDDARLARAERLRKDTAVAGSTEPGKAATKTAASAEKN